MKIALFILQVAADDPDSQRKGVQLVIQVFNPGRSLFLNDLSTREHFRQLLACSPVRFSCIHFCCPDLPSSPSEESKGAADLKSPPPQTPAMIDAAAALLERDERVRTKFHTGKGSLRIQARHWQLYRLISRSLHGSFLLYRFHH